jgi:hypothetical protein
MENQEQQLMQAQMHALHDREGAEPRCLILHHLYVAVRRTLASRAAYSLWCSWVHRLRSYGWQKWKQAVMARRLNDLKEENEQLCSCNAKQAQVLSTTTAINASNCTALSRSSVPIQNVCAADSDSACCDQLHS